MFLISGVAHNGVSRIDVEGQEVLVIGAGAIGLLATSVAKALGASRVIIADINAERLQLAKKMGADATINCKEVDLHSEVMRLTQNNGVSRLVEASGASPLVNTCFKLLQKVRYLTTGLYYARLYQCTLGSSSLVNSVLKSSGSKGTEVI